jgi:hypothetical protein
VTTDPGRPSSRALPRPRSRATLWFAILAAGLGAALVLLGAGRPWATVTAQFDLSGLGRGRVASVDVTGDQLTSLSSLAWFGLILTAAIAFTSGRGRWPVGVALVFVALALFFLTAEGVDRGKVLELVYIGRLEGLPSGAALTMTTSKVGPVLTGAGAALMGGAGVAIMARGRYWPALGRAYRAPGDRGPLPEPGPEDTEPGWEGD